MFPGNLLFIWVSPPNSSSPIGLSQTLGPIGGGVRMKGSPFEPELLCDASLLQISGLFKAYSIVFTRLSLFFCHELLTPGTPSNRWLIFCSIAFEPGWPERGKPDEIPVLKFCWAKLQPTLPLPPTLRLNDYFYHHRPVMSSLDSHCPTHS